MEYGTEVAIGLYILGIANYYYTINVMRVRVGRGRAGPGKRFLNGLLWPLTTLTGLIMVVLYGNIVENKNVK